MTRRKRQEEASGEHDSFLDIVANIVGILIILVVLVGVRAKNAPVTASISDPTKQEAASDVQEDLATAQRIHADILELNRQGRKLVEEAVQRDRRRNEMAMRVSAAERQIESRRKQLDAEARADYDLQRRLAEQRDKLNETIRESILAQSEKSDAKPIDLEHHPTPISHTVHGKEIHIQLRDSRVVVVPFDKLIEQFKGEFERKVYRLQHQRELTDKLGPIDGFRLRYTIERIDVTPELFQQTGRTGSIVRLQRVEFLPINNRLGETLEEAMAEGSEFRRALKRCSPDRTTVTLWTYPDGFDDFQKLKNMLYEMGFKTAARPLPFDVPISASPQGSRSAAQ
ncbi:MAG: hypothetical protein JXM70_07235 [Pirellulales bacterium]|nr:hypothetical protein [Pirellulales bacterium]